MIFSNVTAEEYRKAVKDSVNVFYMLKMLYLISEKIGHKDMPDIENIIQSVAELAADTMDKATAILCETLDDIKEEGKKCSE